MSSMSRRMYGASAQQEIAPAFDAFGAANDALSPRVLRLFVPLNVLSDDHLATLCRELEVQRAVPGQQLVQAESLVGRHLFLLSGELSVSMCTGQTVEVSAGTATSYLSLGDSLPGFVEAVANADCSYFIVDREQLDAMLCWDQVAKTMAVEISIDRSLDEDALWMCTLLASNLFHKIPPYNVREVFERMEARFVQSGEAIVRQGEQGAECYIIKEGNALVTHQRSAGAEPEVIAELGPGRCFGEDALLNHTTRNATVTMESNGVLMCLHKREFFSLLSEPEINAIDLRDAQAAISEGAQWLDVRSQQEFDCAHRSGAFHLPMHLMSLKSRLMNPGTTYIAYCSTGRRASTAAYLLAQQGFKVVPLSQSSHR